MFFFLIQILPWIALSTCNDDDIDISGPTRRVLGGWPVRIEDAPYMALFRPVYTEFHCGASIVSDQFLVTAAHCLTAAEMVVTVGTDRALSGGENYQVEKIIPHPQYGYITSFNNDVAVIKLMSKLWFSARVQPINMAEPDLFIEPFAQLRIIGFGQTESGQSSNELLAGDVPYQEPQTCSAAFYNKMITDRMICVGQTRPYQLKGMCFGDSGGPMLYGDKLVGIASFKGDYCDSYSVYTRVSNVRDFIDQVIATN